MRATSFLLALGAASVALGPWPALADGCRTACERWVTDKAQRAVHCARCALDADPGLWAERLGESPAAEPVLEAALGDPDWPIRAGAARGLARIRRLPVETVICERFTGKPQAQREALELLLHLPKMDAARLPGACARTPSAAAFAAALPSAGPALVLALQARIYDIEAGHRVYALRDLARLTGQPAALQLARSLAARPAGPADRIAADALLLLARAEGTPVSTLLLAGADPALRGAYDRLLGVLAGDVLTVAAGLSEPDPEARRRAVGELGLLGELAAEPLGQAARDDADWKVRFRAAKALCDARGGTPEELLAGIAAAEGPEPQRLRAAQTLSGAATRRTAAVVRPLLGDPRLPQAVSAELLRAVGEAGGPEALELLGPLLDGPLPATRQGAAQALAVQARTPAIASRLAARLEIEPDPQVQAALALGLARAGQGAGIRRLEAFLAPATPEPLRLAAVEAYARLGPEAGHGASSRLCKILGSDPAPPVRRGAALALGRIGGPQAMAAIDRAAREDRDEAVRAAARQILLGAER